MRKILSLFGIIVLCGTVSTNVVACDKKEEPKPTPPIPPSFNKTNLSTITQLTGLHLVADDTKKFKDFNLEILTANEFRNKKATVDDYIIIFYLRNRGVLDIIDDDLQYSNINDIFLEIEAKPNNPYWIGKTNDVIQIKIFAS